MPVYKIERKIETPVVFRVKADTEAQAIAYQASMSESELVEAHSDSHDWYMTSYLYAEEESDNLTEYDYDARDGMEDE